MNEMVVAQQSTALVGTLEEKTKAIDQIAASIATLQLNGWNNVQKVKAGAWLADARGVHPADFIENHWCMEIQGRLMIEPRWEFIVRKLTETVPGFRWKVEVEEDKRAVVWMTDGKSEHRVEYTFADAERQGLVARNKTTWTNNSKEMCLKQAIKRCAKRIGINRAAPLPWVDSEDGREEFAAPTSPGREKSGAAVIDDALGTAKPEPQKVVETTAKAEAEKKPDPIKALSNALYRRFGKQSKAIALEKATDIYNRMIEHETGENPKQRFKSVEEIGPVDAERMVAFMASEKTNGGAATEAAGGTEAAPAGEPEEATEEQGPPIEVEETHPEPETARDPRTPYDRLMDTVKRARKLFSRKFVQEAPEGSGAFWFTDQKVLGQAGDYKSAVKLMANHELQVSVAMLDQLERILREMCDAEERGGR